MERDYYNFSYIADYEAKLFLNDKLIDEHVDEDAACFGHVFSTFGKYSDNDEFLGIYTIKSRKEFEEQSGNFCALEKYQILKILRFMRKEFDIKIRFSETGDKYIFTLHIYGKPVKHKFLLTFSRVFFEFPYTELAADVMKLRARGVVDGVNYSHKNFLELYHLVCISIKEWWTVHSLFVYPEINFKTKTMHERFKAGVHCVCEVYPGDSDLCVHLKRTDKYERLDWVKGFDSRLPRYSENFRQLKKLKYEKNKKGIRRRRRN